MAILGRKPAVAADTRDPVTMVLGLTQPSLYDVVVKDDGSAFDSTYATATVTFSMRPLLSRAPVLESVAARVVNPPLGDDGFNIAYDWADGDTAIEGPYMCWWGIDLPSSSYQETGEFPLVISDHGPGYGTQIGPVVNGIAQYMPTTFEALRSDYTFGDHFFQRFADRAKRETLGYVDTPDLEGQYDLQLIDYLSKLAAKHLVVPAKDYWMRQWRTRTTQSPVEVSAYPDAIAALDQLHARLCAELPSDLRQLRFYIPGLPVAKVMAAPASSLECERHRTLDPNRTPHPSVGGPRWGGLLFP